jgi:hypothetical protein
VLEAQRIVEDEAQGFRRKLLSERVVPTIAALRSQLERICRQELESFKHECGPFSKDQNELLEDEDVVVRITRRIVGSLARELKDLPEKGEQEQTDDRGSAPVSLRNAREGGCRHHSLRSGASYPLIFGASGEIRLDLPFSSPYLRCVGFGGLSSSRLTT